MPAQTTLQFLAVDYPKPIMAKVLNSQSQAWEMMLSQHAICQPITGLGNNAIPECNAANAPLKEPAEAQKDKTGGGGRDFSGSLA